MATPTRVMHWIATYMFCIGAIIVMSLSNVFIARSLLTSESLMTESRSIEWSVSERAKPVKLEMVDNVAMEFRSVVYLAAEPFCSTNPLLFTVMTHSLLMVALPLRYGLGLARKFLSLPSLRIIRKWLGTSRFRTSILLLALLDEEFDDHMIDGRLGCTSSPTAFSPFGLLTTTLLIYPYVWRKSFAFGSVPLGTATQYLYIIFITPLMALILKERLHGLKLLASVACFVGIYFHFFPDPAIIPEHTCKDAMRAICLGSFGAVVFSLYLLYYRVLNPDGYMLEVIGVQGLSCFFFGLVYVGILHGCGVERFALPSSLLDVWMVICHSISNFCSLYCINETLRWGEPLAIATALTTIPSCTSLLSALLDIHPPRFSFHDLISLFLTLMGFSLVAMLHLSRALCGCSMLSIGNRVKREFTLDRGQRKPLIAGSHSIM